MFSLKSIPSTASVLSTYTTFTALAMLVRSVVSEVQTISSQLIPEQLQTILLSKFVGFWGTPPSQVTLLIDEYDGYTINQLYEASEIYLATKITASVDKLKVSLAPRDKTLSVTIDKDENIIDIFEDIQLKWRTTCIEMKEASQQGKYEKRVIELSFHKKRLEKVVKSYLPYVLERSKATKEEKKVVKLYSLGNYYAEYQGEWASTNLDHPATFETLAMDATLKKELVDDLDRFLRRKDFYRRVGKAWKRGYLLYGPPGTGKSSLIAAMANYLKFSIYDLELASIYSNSDLRRLLVSTTNRSILVIEDIDCSIELKDRQAGDTNQSERQLTLSGLLNFIDGLWSSCGDERIIVFTTNHKDKLDPALLRPGRMDMHIHMSYCTPSGFRILASNYLGITSHKLFTQIDELMMEVEVTPAEVAEGLMKSEDADIALEGLIKFLQNKKSGSCKFDPARGNEDSKCETNTGSKRKGRGRTTGNTNKKVVKRKYPKRLKFV
ncbi:ATP binding protein, putative [Theobroma cacao]|uniref:ATP binding protein, putative n=1 Tax=Theobroma cacao TaxID=3641 RepID=A0A061E928_THECC|nr:ATP binding protein, putative [Theobroma cacao]